MTPRLPSRAVLVVVVGLLVAVAGGLAVQADASSDVNERLEGRADRVAATLQLQLARYGSVSRTLAALRAGEPTQAAWVDLVEQLGIEQDLPSVFSIASTTLVTPATVGDLDVPVLPPLDDRTVRPDRLLVIDRVAPLDPNRGALGFDVLTSPDAAGAAVRAIDEELVSLSEALTLVQEPGDQTGLVVYAPWYREDGTLGGATDLVLRGQDFLDALAGEVGDVSVTVMDAVGDETRVIGTIGSAPDGADGTTRAVSALGQSWTIAVEAPAGFASDYERLAGLLTATGLLLLTGLVAALVTVLERREEHARSEVAERTAELVTANRQLTTANAAKDDFLAVITHEFRTPIAVIRGFAETAQSGRFGDVPEHLQTMLSRIDRQARRLNGVVDDILTTARLRSGGLRVRPEIVDLAPLVEAAVAEHPELSPVAVELDGPMTGWVDPTHVVRVIEALLSNVVKYGRSPVRVDGSREGDEVVLRVADCGDGVAEDRVTEIFSPFEQADQGDRRVAQGLGLGLTLVRELCERMGGTVAYLPDYAPGATFEVRLPAES